MTCKMVEQQKATNNKITFFLLTYLSSLCGYVITDVAVNPKNSQQVVKNVLRFTEIDVFASLLHAPAVVISVFIALICFYIGFVALRALLAYFLRMLKTFSNIDAHLQHFILAVIGPCVSIIIVNSTLLFHPYKIGAFEGDLLMSSLVCLLLGCIASISLAKEDQDGAENITDLYSREVYAEHLERTILKSLETPTSHLPRTLAIVGDRGSGKSFTVKILINRLKKRNKQIKDRCLDQSFRERIKRKMEPKPYDSISIRVVKPWDYDSYNDFYKDVVEFIIETIELDYVIPNKKKIGETLLKNDLGKPQGIVADAVAFYGVTDEQKKISEIKKWIKSAGKVLLVFDDLDRCHQSEVRAVLRLIDRFEAYTNLFMLSCIDHQSLVRFEKFNDRIELPTKVSA